MNFLLSSEVFIGGWKKSAARLPKSNQEDLSKMPVWIYSGGPKCEGGSVELIGGWTFLEKLKSVAERIQPTEMVFFISNVDCLARINLTYNFDFCILD